MCSCRMEKSRFFYVLSPHALAHENATQEVSVAYVIRSLPNASGLYIFFVTPGKPIYLSFGQGPSSVYFTAWTSGPRLPPGTLPTSYSIMSGTNVNAVSVPWA